MLKSASNKIFNKSSDSDTGSKNVFLLLSLPFNIPYQRYYPAAYVAGIVKDAGWQCAYKDYNFFLYQKSDQKIKDSWNGSYSELFEKSVLEGLNSDFAKILEETLSEIINSSQVKMVGVTTSKYGRYFIETFLKFYRSVDIQPPLIFGGTDCFPVYYGKRYFSHELTPDILLQGEAELALPDFLNQYEKTRSIATDIPGFVYKDADGNLVDTGQPESPNMPDCEVVADFDIFDNRQAGYDDTITSFTSRGCINKCAFCDAWMSSTVRYRNYDAIVKEIMVQAAGKRSQLVSLRDPNLNTSIGHIRRLCNAFIDAGLEVKWGGMGCFVVDLPDEVVDLMKRSGFINFMIGLESASPEVIQNMGKRYDINKAQDMIRRFVRRGMVVQLPLISGFPGETTIDFLTTIAFVLKYRTNPFIRFSFSNRCRLHEKAFINMFPQDFFINQVNKPADKWTSCDASNTYNTRELRAALLTLLVQDKMIYVRNCKKNIEAIDFNGKDMAQELAELISRLGVLTDTIEESLNLLKGTEDQSSMDLSGWYVLDKNGPYKEKILEYIFKSFESLGELLEQEQFLDIHHFRKEIFGVDRYQEIDDSKDELEISSARTTAYDKGKYVIICGNIHSSKNNCQIESVCAIAGGHIVEFFCRLPQTHEWSPGASETLADPVSGKTGFWGKVKQSYFKEDELKIAVFYDDSTMSSFSYTPGQISDLIDAHSKGIASIMPEIGFLPSLKKNRLPVTHTPMDIHQVCKDQPYISKENPIYRLGDVIMFDGTGNGDKFITRGFASPLNVSWTIALKAKLQLLIDQVPSDSTLELDFDAVTRDAADGSGRDFFEVYINQTNCGTFPITHQKLKTYKIDLERFRLSDKDVLNIEFVLGDPPESSLPVQPASIPRVGLKSLAVNVSS